MSKYTLAQKPAEKRNVFIVTIKADHNDADYITTIESYSKDDFDEYVADALIDLINNYSGDYDLEHYFNEFDLDIPRGDEERCHTLESVNVEYIDENGITWDVKLNLN